jgi:DUF971 family protein
MYVASGIAHAFYPVATEQRCTAAVLLEVDPVALVKGHRPDELVLAQYVNDRPYAASSLLAVALQRLFRTALARPRMRLRSPCAGIRTRRPRL